MQKVDWIWQNGVIKPWADATVHCLSHGLHYGSGVFEGMRFYPQKNAGDKPLISVFRLKEHLDRLEYSAKSLGMEIKYSQDELIKATYDLIKKNNLKTGYIRLLVNYGYGSLRVNPEGVPIDICMAAFPLDDFLPHKEVNVKTSEYIRIHPKSTVVDAKICGHYVNSILADLEIKNTKYDEILFLDNNGYIAEGAAQNLFFVKNNIIYTPKLGNILAGITRDSIINLARYLGYKVIEGEFSISQLKEANEAFFTGTAVEITPIKQIDDVVFNNINPITNKIKDNFFKLVRSEFEISGSSYNSDCRFDEREDLSERDYQLI
jgi:branched-chain amino acid aminotransferase